MSSSIDCRTFGKTVSQVVKIYSLVLALYIDIVVILAIISQNTDSPKFIVITFETRGNRYTYNGFILSFARWRISCQGYDNNPSIIIQSETISRVKLWMVQNFKISTPITWYLIRFERFTRLLWGKIPYPTFEFRRKCTPVRINHPLKRNFEQFFLMKFILLSLD